MKRFLIFSITIFSVLLMNAAVWGKTPLNDLLPATYRQEAFPMFGAGNFQPLGKGGADDLVSSTLVISQVYGGAGCGTAGCSVYRNDFIEIFNRGTSPVNVSGWSVQYASATGSAWQVTPLTNFTIQPGKYYLVAESFSANGQNSLPTPDATGTIAMSATAGKVALVNGTTALTGACPTGVQIIDFVGYGTTADCSESAPAPSPSVSSSIVRLNGGIQDTDNNSVDFSASTANPRNSASPANAVFLTINDVSQNEGNAGTTAFTFTVSLSTAAHGGVTFNIATADGTATTAAGDYTANSLTGQTIPNGSSSYQFTVQVNGDTTFEPNQTFFVNVTNLTGATLTDGQGLGTVVNDDAAPQFSIADASVTEGDAGTANLNFTVTKTGATEAASTVQAATADGTANAGTDYTANSQTLTFGPNETTKTLTVVVNGDTATEPNENLFVNLSNPTNATIGDNQAEGVILNDDDESATVEFASSNYSEDESQTAFITVTRSGALNETTTVNYSTMPTQPARGVNNPATGGASCTVGVDFIHTSGTLVFAPEQESADIEIQLCGDDQVEAEEFFNVYLSNVQNGVLGDITSAQVFINDTASRYRNTNPIFIGTGGDSYASSITVSGIPSNIGGLRVTLYDFNHLKADDIDVLLVGPQGQKFLLMADAGGEDGLTEDPTITFDDNAGQILPNESQIFSGKYEPTTWEPGQTGFPAPAPAGPYAEPGSAVGGPVTLASVFGGTNANGTWSLFIRDDNGALQQVGADGAVFGGWGLQFFAPTAAGVSVSGFVHSGKTPIANATVMVTGGGSTEPLITKTNSFGLYKFEGLPAGQTYVVTVVSRRYNFPQSSIVLNLEDSVENADFEAEEK